MNASDQDWTPVVLKKTTAPAKGSGGGGGGGSSMAKLENDTESLSHKTVDVGMAKRIMQARMAKKMSQKDLAQACAIDAKVVNEYEQGKGIPNQAIITKLEKALGARLRPEKAGKGKGKGKK